jgi:DNA-binding XRE family transcriptional regulator/phosphopantetheine adenylyltransferase
MGAQEAKKLNKSMAYSSEEREQIIQQVVALHNQGYSQVNIADIIGVSRGTLFRWNKEESFFKPRTPGEAGKIASKIYDYDENYFEVIDTPNKAYIIGFLLGDGTISLKNGSSKRIILMLAEEDKKIIYDIANELGLVQAIKFRRKNAPNEQNKYSLIINSTKMADDLIKLGIKPKKTGKEKWIKLANDELQWHFIRGLFDADGHIRVYQRLYKRKTKPSQSYLKARFGLTGNLELLEAVLLFLKTHNIAQNVNSIHHKQGCYDLYVSSFKDLLLLFEYLYKNSDLKLERKHQKFLSLKNKLNNN